MKKLVLIASIAMFLVSCGGGGSSKAPGTTESAADKKDNANPSYDPNRGKVNSQRLISPLIWTQQKQPEVKKCLM